MASMLHSLLIAATTQTIYTAITTDAGLSAWWTPGAKSDAQIGGTAIFPFGPGYKKEVLITEMVQNKLVRWNCINGAQEWIGTTISFELEQTNRVTVTQIHPELTGQLEQLSGELITLLKFRHDGWQGLAPMYAECNYTWGRFLHSLKLYCETNTGTPWPTQHKTS